MANLFAASGEIAGRDPPEFPVATLREYFTFLSANFPVYVASDFSTQAVYDCVEEYPELYQRCKDKSGKTVIRLSGNKIPNLEFFNSPFSKDISTHICRMTKLFLKTGKK